MAKSMIKYRIFEPYGTKGKVRQLREISIRTEGDFYPQVIEVPDWFDSIEDAAEYIEPYSSGFNEWVVVAVIVFRQ